jgi:hypothetical protein
VRAVVTCGSGDAVVLADRVADAAQRVTGLKRDVVGDPTDGADQGEQFGDAVARIGWWKAGAAVDLGQSAESPQDVRKPPSAANDCQRIKVQVRAPLGASAQVRKRPSDFNMSSVSQAS